MDPTKEIPKEIKEIDIKKKLAKKRFETRYQLEKEYAERGYNDKLKNDERALNRVYKKKYGDELLKGYDILTLDPVEKKKVEEYTTVPHAWDKLSSTQGK